MAIAFDASTWGETGSAATLQISHTLGGGSDRVVYAAVHGSDATFTATYDGEPMTELYDGTPGAPFQFIAVFVIKEADLPAAGTYNIVFTPNSNQSMSGAAMSFTGVDQTTPNDAIQVATNTGTAVSVTVSSAAGDLVIDFVSVNTTDDATVGANQTARENQESPVSRNVFCSTEPGGASIAMTWTLDSSAAWTSAGLNLNAAGGGGGTAVPVFVQQMKSQGMA